MNARFLSIAEAAEILGIHERTAYRLIDSGEFPVRVQRIGSKLKVSSVLLDRLLDVDEARAS